MGLLDGQGKAMRGLNNLQSIRELKYAHLRTGKRPRSSHRSSWSDPACTRPSHPQLPVQYWKLRYLQSSPSSFLLPESLSSCCRVQIAMASSMPVLQFGATSVVVATGFLLNFISYFVGSLEPSGCCDLWEKFISAAMPWRHSNISENDFLCFDIIQIQLVCEHPPKDVLAPIIIC